MYAESSWPTLAQALANAAERRRCRVCSPSTTSTTCAAAGSAPTSNSLEAFQVISCMDTVERPTVAEDDADVAKLKAVAPRFAIRNRRRVTSARSSRRRPTRASQITGKGAGPIVVFGTTGDPATPLDGTAQDGRSPRARPPRDGRRESTHRLRHQRLLAGGGRQLSRRPRRSLAARRSALRVTLAGREVRRTVPESRPVGLLGRGNTPGSAGIAPGWPDSGGRSGIRTHGDP